MKNLSKILLLCLSFNLMAQSEKPSMNFGRYNFENGLPMTEVYKIVEDRYGFLWLFNYQMVCKFDGINFFPYRQSQSNPSNFPRQQQSGIVADNNGEIWLTHANGISFFDYKINKFKNFSLGFQTGESALKLIFDSLNNAWIGTNKGRLFYFDTKKNKVNKIIQIQDTAIKSLLWINDRTLWIGGQKGIYCLVKNSFFVENIIETPFHSEGLQDGVITLCKDSKNIVWASISLEGIWQIDWKTKKVIKIIKNIFPFSDNSFSDIIESKYLPNTFWLASGTQGLIRYDQSKDQFFSYIPENSNEQSIGSYWINDLLEDKTGNLWIAGNGLFKYNRRANIFILDQLFLDPKNVIWEPAMYFEELDNRQVMIGTWGKGLFIYDIQKKQITKHILLDKPKTFVQTFLLKPSKSVVLVGTNEAIWVHDFKKNVSKNLSEINSLTTGQVDGIVEDSQRRFWIVAKTGIFIFDENYQFSKKIAYPNNAYNANSGGISSVFCDASGKIWIGANGLFCYDEKHGKFIEDKFFSKKEVRQVVESPKGTLWVATSIGLIKTNVAGSEHQIFDVESGFSENYIHQIQVDAKGNIWTSGNLGLNFLNPKENIIRNYTTRDGLKSNQFVLGFCKGKSGRFYTTPLAAFGFHYFYPDSLINMTSEVAQLQFSQIKIADKSINFDQNKLNSIDLPSDSPLLNISFALLNFANFRDNQYYYKLEGADNDWISLKNQNNVTFSNLKFGKYLLRIKARNGDGLMNRQELTMQINVATPYYQTWWFFLLVFGGISGVFYAFYRIRLNRIIELQKLRNNISRDLHDEVGSTLSSISMLSTSAKNAIDNDQIRSKKIIENIGSNAQKMLESMDDIVWAINPKDDSYENMIVRMREYAYGIAEAKNIEMNFEVDSQLAKIKIPMQVRRNIYLIFKESINNLVKHSGCSKANIFFKINHKVLIISILDNGKGFDTNQISNRNGLRNMNQRADEIGGKFEVKSIIGQGTAVKFEMLIA